MARYVIGDIQGCLKPLEALLSLADFTPGKDTLWVAGDLVNRGPDNLGVLRLIRSFNEHAVAVLGNHDLHLLAIAAGARPLKSKDTVQDVLAAPDRDQLLSWLRHRPLMVLDDGYSMSHAGIPHIWRTDEAAQYANEVEQVLRGPAYKDFFQHMYGDQPDCWHPDLRGWERLRMIANYFTRMRFIGDDGRLDFGAKESADRAPQGMSPWFEQPREPQDSVTLLFGHWAALEGHTGRANAIALDTGCVWGNRLTMIRLEDGRRFHVSCANNG